MKSMISRTLSFVRVSVQLDSGEGAEDAYDKNAPKYMLRARTFLVDSEGKQS